MNILVLAFFILFPIAVIAEATMTVDIENLIIEKAKLHKDISSLPNIQSIVLISPKYLASNLIFSNDVKKIPVDVRTETFAFENCTTSERTIAKTMTVHKSSYVEASITNAVETKEDTSLSFGTSNNLPFSLNANLAKTITMSLTHQNTVRKEASEDVTWNETRSVKPGKRLVVSASLIGNISRYSFTAPIVVAGIIRVTRLTIRQIADPSIGIINYIHIPVTNDFNLVTLFPSEVDRTFFAKGFIDNGSHDDIRINYSEKSIDKNDPSICPSLFMTSRENDGLFSAQSMNQSEISSNGELIAVSENKFPTNTSSADTINKIIETQIASHKTETNLPHWTVNKDVSTTALEGNIIRQFFARGEHQCQSDTSIGHKCEVRGSGYFDCNQAEANLRRKSCCATSQKGGSSIGFKLTKCSSITP